MRGRARSGAVNVVTRHRARSTGTVVLVIDNRDRSFDCDDPNGWFNLCDDHGNVVSHATRRLAVHFASAPEQWCADCQSVYEYESGPR
jgi:hypothetical protein